MTIGDGIELAHRVAEKLGIKQKIAVYKNFGTAMLHLEEESLQIEFVGARKESYSHDSRKPFVASGSLADDQNRRDFTINAMAISLNQGDYGQLIDPFNGIHDISEKIIRTPLDPDITFNDDPLRMMRAVRFASQLSFKIHPVTFEAIKRNAHRLGIVSAERIADELNKIMMSDKPSVGLKLLSESGLLVLFLKEVEDLRGAEYIDGRGHKDNFTHTLQVVDNISLHTDNLWLRWSALLHDIGKPITKKFDRELGWTFHMHDYAGTRMVRDIFRRLKLPMKEPMKYVEKMVLLHLRPISLTEETVTDSAIRRLLFDAGDDIDDLMTLCESDITSKNSEKVKRFRNNLKLVRIKLVEIEEKDRIRNWQPPISGEFIMETFQIGPCREVGIIKNYIKDAILDGKIANNFDEAYAMMISLGKDLGLTAVRD